MTNIFKGQKKGLVAVITGLFVVTNLALPVVSTVFAAAVFNQGSQPYDFLRVGNSTDNGGTYNWDNTSTNAELGDKVAAVVFFNNTGEDAADNARVRIYPTVSSNGQQVTIRGYIWAGNAPQKSELVTVNLTGGGAITSVDHLTTTQVTHWNPQHVVSLSGDPEDVLGGGGLQIGSVEPGERNAGFVVVSFRINGSDEPESNLEVTADTHIANQNDATITCGVNGTDGRSTRVWVEYGMNDSIDDLDMDSASKTVSNDGAVTIHISGLSESTRYYYRCAAENGEGSDASSIRSFLTTTHEEPVADAPAVTTLSATSIDTDSATLNCTVDANGASTNAWFEWGTNMDNLNYDTGSVSVGSGETNANVSKTITGLSDNTRYYFRCVGQNGEGTDTGDVRNFVTTDSGPVADAPAVTTLSATSIDTDSATLNCTVDANGASTNAWFEWGTNMDNLNYDTGSVSVGSGETNANVSKTITGLSDNTRYYFRCVGQNGEGTDTGDVRNFVTNGEDEPSDDLEVTTGTADDVSYDEAVLICDVNGTNDENTDVWIQYGKNESNLYGDSDEETVDGDGEVSITIDGLDEDARYYYRCAADNNGDSDTGSVRSFTTDDSGDNTSNKPSATTLSADNIDGDSARLRCEVDTNGDDADVWFGWGEDSGLDEDTSKVSVSDGETNQVVTKTITGLDEDTKYYFQCFIEDDGGETDEGSVKNFTTDENGGNNNGDQPDVTTVSPVAVTQTSAVIRGEVDANNSDAETWFEWGTSVNGLTRDTSREDVGDGDNVKFDFTLTGLAANTTYFYRALAENDEGEDSGVVLSFRTGAPLTNVITRIIETIRPVQVEEEEEVQALIITLNTDRTNVDENSREIDYTVSYDNRTGETFTNATLVVDLPNELNYVDADPNADDETDDVLTFEIGTISPDEQGSFVITTDVDADVNANDNIRFVGDVEYTDSGTRKLVTVIDEHTFGELISGSTGGTFTALLLDSLKNFFTSPILWLILLGLLVYFIIRYFVAGRDKRSAALV